MQSRGRLKPFWITLPFGTSLSLGFFLLINAATESSSRLNDAESLENGRAAYLESKISKPLRAEKDTDFAIKSGTRWLVDHQFSDGMWSARAFNRMCLGDICLGSGNDQYDIAITGLAVLAILESGQALDLKYETAARKALQWLVGQQDLQGCFGQREGKFIYGHSIVTLAFSRAFRILGDPMMKYYARRGIRFLEQSQNPGHGWRYGFQGGESDSSVTAWAAAAVIAGKAIDIEIGPATMSGILAWFDKMTGPTYYEVSYMTREAGPSAIRGVNDHFEKNETLTAFAASTRVGLGVSRDHKFVREAARRLSWNLPVWNAKGTSVDYYYWYAGMLALCRVEKPNSYVRTLWAKRLRGLLGRHQERDRCVDGSWSPVDKWGSEGGRVYATAINVLTLAMAHR